MLLSVSSYRVTSVVCVFFFLLSFIINFDSPLVGSGVVSQVFRHIQKVVLPVGPSQQPTFAVFCILIIFFYFHCVVCSN